MNRVRNIEHQRNQEVLEKVDIQKYSRLDGFCPFCRGEVDDGREFYNIDDDTFPELEVPVECENCGKKWFEVYTLQELTVRSR
jgi:ribosomal protein S27AE